jgi:hypothetical protein
VNNRQKIILVISLILSLFLYAGEKSFFDAIKKDPFYKVIMSIEKTIQKISKYPNIDCLTKVAIEYIKLGIAELTWDPYSFKFEKDNPQRKLLLENYTLALMVSYILLERINTYADVLLSAVETNNEAILEKIGVNIIKYIIISFDLKKIVKTPCSDLRAFMIKELFGFGECADSISSREGFKALREQINKEFPQTKIDTTVCNCKNIYPLDRVYWVSLLHDIPEQINVTDEDLQDEEKKKGALVYDKFNSTFMHLWLATMAYEFPHIYQKMLKEVKKFGKGLIESSVASCEKICKGEESEELTKPLELDPKEVFKIPESDFGKKCIKEYEKFVVTSPKCMEDKTVDMQQCKQQLYTTLLYYNYIYNERSIAFWCELFANTFKIFTFYDSNCSTCAYLDICKCDQIKKIQEERKKEEKENMLDCAEEILKDRFIVDMPRFAKACFPPKEGGQGQPRR